MDRLGVDRAFVVFGAVGPYDHNPYDTPLPSFDFPKVFRALYEAVHYAKDIRSHGWDRAKISMFERADLDRAGRGGVPSTVVWRSWREGASERDPRRRRARRRRARRDSSPRARTRVVRKLLGGYAVETVPIGRAGGWRRVRTPPLRTRAEAERYARRTEKG